jgi:DNA gyrase subunit A
MMTRKGTVKRIAADSLKNIRSVGIRALTLEEGDELISVRETDGEQNILLMTHLGMAICFRETDVRAMGRDAVGVRGIRLREGDFVVAGVRAIPGRTLLAITENGYGKRTDIADYLRGDGPQSRGGLGMKGYQVTDKTGPIAGAKVVSGEEDVLLISDDGTIIRMASADVSTYGRATQGVRLMRLGEGVKVISMARAEKEAAEGEEILSEEE